MFNLRVVFCLVDLGPHGRWWFLLLVVCCCCSCWSLSLCFLCSSCHWLHICYYYYYCCYYCCCYCYFTFSQIVLLWVHWAHDAKKLLKPWFRVLWCWTKCFLCRTLGHISNRLFIAPGAWSYLTLICVIWGGFLGANYRLSKVWPTSKSHVAESPSKEWKGFWLHSWSCLYGPPIDRAKLWSITT